jgi:hypothetical protein
MGNEAITGNMKACLEQLNNMKPTEGKGVKTGAAFWKAAFLSRTMHKKSYEVDTQTIDPASVRFWRGPAQAADDSEVAA